MVTWTAFAILAMFEESHMYVHHRSLEQTAGTFAIIFRARREGKFTQNVIGTDSPAPHVSPHQLSDRKIIVV